MIEVNNRTRTAADETLLQNVAVAVLKGENKSSANLSIALVGEKRAAELNKTYRKKDKVANVLAFPFDSVQGKPAGKASIPSESEGYIGEIILCPQEIKKEASRYGMIYPEALSWMLVHGMLHLLGYDHTKADDAQEMEEKERLYLSSL